MHIFPTRLLNAALLIVVQCCLTATGSRVSSKALIAELRHYYRKAYAITQEICSWRSLTNMKFTRSSNADGGIIIRLDGHVSLDHNMKFVSLTLK